MTGAACPGCNRFRDPGFWQELGQTVDTWLMDAERYGFCDAEEIADGILDLDPDLPLTVRPVLIDMLDAGLDLIHEARQAAQAAAEDEADRIAMEETYRDLMPGRI